MGELVGEESTQSTGRRNKGGGGIKVNASGASGLSLDAGYGSSFEAEVLLARAKRRGGGAFGVGGGSLWHLRAEVLRLLVSGAVVTKIDTRSLAASVFSLILASRQGRTAKELLMLGLRQKLLLQRLVKGGELGLQTKVIPAVSGVKWLARISRSLLAWLISRHLVGETRHIGWLQITFMPHPPALLIRDAFYAIDARPRVTSSLARPGLTIVSFLRVDIHKPPARATFARPITGCPDV